MNKYIKKEYYIFGSALLIFVVPVFTFAITLGVNTDTNFKDVVDYIRSIVDILIPILIGLSFIVFFWGLSKFILNANNPAEIQKGKNYMMWGIVALFILATFRAIIGLVSNEFEIGRRIPNENTIKLPER